MFVKKLTNGDYISTQKINNIRDKKIEYVDGENRENFHRPETYLIFYSKEKGHHIGLPLHKIRIIPNIEKDVTVHIQLGRYNGKVIYQKGETPKMFTIGHYYICKYIEYESEENILRMAHNEINGHKSNIWKKIPYPTKNSLVM